MSHFRSTRRDIFETASGSYREKMALVFAVFHKASGGHEVDEAGGVVALNQFRLFFGRLFGLSAVLLATAHMANAAAGCRCHPGRIRSAT